jgi:hypothetical protein
MSNFNYNDLQQKLDKSKDLIQNLNVKFEYHDRKQKIQELENEYKKLCSQFSPAYLSGCPWYVGESIVEGTSNKSIENLFFMIGCALNSQVQ